jgi:hypothetical protein
MFTTLKTSSSVVSFNKVKAPPRSPSGVCAARMIGRSYEP